MCPVNTKRKKTKTFVLNECPRYYSARQFHLDFWFILCFIGFDRIHVITYAFKTPCRALSLIYFNFSFLFRANINWNFSLLIVRVQESFCKNNTYCTWRTVGVLNKEQWTKKKIGVSVLEIRDVQLLPFLIRGIFLFLRVYGLIGNEGLQ